MLDRRIPYAPSLLLLALSVVGSPGSAAPRFLGLVGSWSFDHDRGNVIRDESGCGNHGLAVQAPHVAGKVGLALRFAQPQSHVKVWCAPELNLGSSVTLEAWIFPVAPGPASRVIIAKNDEYALRIDKRSEGGRLSFFPHVGRPAVTWEPRVSSRTPLSAGVWHHVAAVWNGRWERLYVDGRLEAEKSRTGQPNPNPYPVMIGNWEYPSCHGTCFGGLIDEVRIWSRPLTAREITAHAASR